MADNTLSTLEGITTFVILGACKEKVGSPNSI
jgi:hypothetical protein